MIGLTASNRGKGNTFLSLILVTLVLLGMSANPARAHFGMAIPSTNHVDQAQKEVEIIFSFAHPFENLGMDLEWPRTVFVYGNSTKQDLKGIMLETSLFDRQAWGGKLYPTSAGRLLVRDGA